MVVPVSCQQANRRVGVFAAIVGRATNVGLQGRVQGIGVDIDYRPSVIHHRVFDDDWLCTTHEDQCRVICAASISIGGGCGSATIGIVL